MKMANESTSNQKKLTLDDPIGKEALDKLADLETAEINASLQLMGMEQEKIKLLAAGRRIEDERHRLFEKLLMERGLPPGTAATIDSTTGKMTLVPHPGAPPPPVPPSPPAAQANGQG
jgi:hypothetical protein